MDYDLEPQAGQRFLPVALASSGYVIAATETKPGQNCFLDFFFGASLSGCL